MAGLGVTLLAALLVAVPARATDEAQQQPVYIEADAVEIDEARAVSLYLGNVEMRQGDMQILADRVEVTHRPDRRPLRIIAMGQPARYRQQAMTKTETINGRSRRMEYDAERDEIALIDQAELTQGQDRFASDRIVYHRASGRVRAGASAAGRERVKIVIHPNDS